MIRVFQSVGEWQEFQKSIRGGSLGFVPTLGALHEGHASLVRKSVAENERTLVSIFVNPTQFNQAQDLEKYPRTWDEDLSLLERERADFVLAPRYEELYPDNYRYQVIEKELSKTLCGAHRAGHFEGVLTVVLKLLNLAQASSAYFGEKDYQQLKLVEGMAAALFLPTRIVGMPTAREADGLAMSSRNLRLSPDQRELAPRLFQLLRSRDSDEDAARELGKLGFKVDYVQTLGNRRLSAAFLGEVRLIDNVEIGKA